MWSPLLNFLSPKAPSSASLVQLPPAAPTARVALSPLLQFLQSISRVPSGIISLSLTVSVSHPSWSLEYETRAFAKHGAVIVPVQYVPMHSSTRESPQQYSRRAGLLVVLAQSSVHCAACLSYWAHYTVLLCRQSAASSAQHQFLWTPSCDESGASGPPASGKGTQCKLLAERFGLIHLVLHINCRFHQLLTLLQQCTLLSG